jgi:hypothetical protein
LPSPRSCPAWFIIDTVLPGPGRVDCAGTPWQRLGEKACMAFFVFLSVPDACRGIRLLSEAPTHLVILPPIATTGFFPQGYVPQLTGICQTLQKTCMTSLQK